MAKKASLAVAVQCRRRVDNTKNKHGKACLNAKLPD